MLSPQFCCCAVPLVNAGIYALLSEQFALSILAGVLAIATPTVVGSYVPSYTPYILAALSFIVAAVQLIGFYGVFKEQRKTFKMYAVLNTLVFAGAFILTGALIAVSGVRHDEAVAKCQSSYYADNTDTTSEGKQVCDAFVWADLGIMAGLWLLLLVVQTYLCFITRVYAKNQKDEHQRYKSIYDQNAEEFAMVEQMQRYGVPGDAWDHRPSLDSLAEQERMADGSAFNRPYSYAPPGQGRMKSSSSLKFSDQVVDTGLSYHAGGDRESPASAAEYREYQQQMEDQQREMEYAQYQQQEQGHQYPPPIQTHDHGYANEEYEHEHHQGQTAPSASSPSHYSSNHTYEQQPQQMPMPMPMAPPEYSSGYAQAHDGGAVASGGPSRGDGKHGYVAR